MANSKMLIDATHPEETRVVVQRNGRVEEFDFESAARKLLRGNIYLAKVTRVEPSLQAAFVDYGGNRHGFLAFNEIHPDYYQIPVADRQALIEEEAAAEAELEAAADKRAEALARRSGYRHSGPDEQPAMLESAVETEDARREGDVESGEASHIVDVEEDEHIEEVGGEAAAAAPQTMPAAFETSGMTITEALEPPTEGDVGVAGDDLSDVPPSAHHEAEDDEDDEDDGAEDAEDTSEALDGTPQPQGDQDFGQSGESNQRRQPGSSRGEYQDDAPRHRRRPRSYKIQEVIKRRQIILVQVVKEERGNKGAALTTYLSLAGRYTVLMPNTARGGGISRKITNPQDRKRLKAIAQELEVPEGMGLIIRTAGAARTKQEIKRDFEYLLRLWESVRDLTLQSTAPALVYEEGDLIKRSIRDLYNKDVEEIAVAGDAGYQEAAAFMQMLMPSHIKNVIEYKDPTPLFTRFGVERQLNAMFQPQVTLRSGGYIVINQTEALVAIDVNSGKSTREFSIEETALATNLEAADEIARQLKLRDLAGLIVIDFIDMEEKRNNRSVERRLKDALRFDRARIQLGRISHFGLMEMSRQRLRTGVLEGSTSQCPHCQGTGVIRSTESIALAVLRGLEDTITAGAQAPLVATCATNVALYILNSKRSYITEMETRHGYPVSIIGSDRMHGANFSVERGVASALPVRRPERAAVNMNWGFDGEGDAPVEETPPFETSNIEMIDDTESGEGEARSFDGRSRDRDDDDGQRRGRRRGRGRGRDDRGRGDRNRDDFRQGHAANIENGHAADASRDDDGQPGAANVTEDGGDDEQSANGGERPDDRPDDRQDDRPGRRRRRGRRGGRRGRERDRGDGPREAAPFEENGGDFDNEQAHADAAGLGPQPDVGAASVRETNGAHSDQRPSNRPSNRPDHRPDHKPDNRPDNRQEPRPQRQARIWDRPSRGAPQDAASVPAQMPVQMPVPVPVQIQIAPAVIHAHQIASAPIETKAVEPPQPPRRRHEADSIEPRLERVVVTPGADGGEPAQDPAVPQRKGWWQRRFGGE